MFRMEVDSPASDDLESISPQERIIQVDSPTSDDLDPISPQERIIQRLDAQGVPAEYLERLQPGLTEYYKNNKFQLPVLVTTILFTDDSDDVEAAHFQESMVWLQWLMFEGDPEPVLKNLASSSTGQRGVCGAVWGNNDIAYRCRTCEHDPTCAICVPCFQNGNHKDHDYSIIYTGGGCCDCGDVTAWKRDGFCSKHKGAEQIQPLSKELADSMGPVLDLLFSFWKSSLTVAETVYLGSSSVEHRADELKIADGLANAVVQMLLEFCNFSESLLSFTSGKVLSSIGLLDILVRAERFLSDEDVQKLHGLLLKMLSEPLFKYEFAMVFLNYYPTVVSDAIRESNDTVFKKYPLLSTFSVQIFTVPTLTPRLVKEKNLLVLLLECLGNIFVSCAGEDERLEISKWANLYETTLRVVEDVRFVMCHAVVPRYIVNDRRDIAKMWMKLLAFMQGMNPQQRETGIHIEEENENMHLPFVLGHAIANIHTLLVAAGFPQSSEEEKDEENLFNSYQSYYDDRESPRHAKVGKHSEESSVGSEAGRITLLGSTSGVANIESDHSCQPGVSCLTNECLKAIESWLGTDNTSGTLPRTENKLGNNFFGLKKTLSRFRRGLTSISELQGRHHSSIVQNGDTGGHVDTYMASGRVREQETGSPSIEENTMETEYASEVDALRFLCLSDWPDISYDVSSQDISVHIPLHRLLSSILQKAVKNLYGELTSPKTDSISSLYRSSAISLDFFGNVLAGCHPHGFSAFIMEHPLRIRVFCAQVRAGMWKKNGDGAILSWEWYRSVRWSQQGLELDLFLLQCCAALAPAELFVSRILDRFGLLNYLSLNPEPSSEYEPVLVHEMLSLIIQIVQERRFCGLSPTACLQRELIYKLAIGNATHSQLLKSLPRDLSKIENLQEVLDSVAVYCNPSGMNQGMYKLRLEFWKHLDLYHPRWNQKDLQNAEERYLHFCQASALTSQLPKWTSIHKPFDGIANIATCEMVLQIIRAVLFYAVYTKKSNSSRAPDSVLLTALHLLSLALDICLQQRDSSKSFPILAFAGQEVSSRHANGSYHGSLLSLLVTSMRMRRREGSDNFPEAGNINFSPLIENILKKMAELDPGCMIELQKLAPEVVSHFSHSSFASGSYHGDFVSEVDKRKAKARERQAAIMEKMRAQQSKFLESVNSAVSEESEGSKSGEGPSDPGIVAEESTQDACSLCHDFKSKRPLCFLILLQKSRLVSLVDRGRLSWKDICYSKKEKLPEISPSSNSSISTSNSGQFCHPVFTKQMQSGPDEFSSDRRLREVNSSEVTFSSFEMLEDHIYFSIRQQMHDNNLAPSDILDRDCRILMGDESPKIDGTESLLLVKYTAALSKESRKKTSASESTRSRSAGPSESSKPVLANDGLGPVDCDGIHVSSCGHAVHQACLDRYLSSVKERFLRRISYEGVHIVDPDQGEFLCPVCRGLANSVLSASPDGSERLSKPPRDPIVRGDSISCLTSVRKEIGNHFLLGALSLLRSASDVVGQDEILRAFPKNQADSASPYSETVFRVLSGFYFPGKQDNILGSERLGHSVIMWDTLKYSLVSTEIASRCRRSSLAPDFTTDALFKELKSTKGFILSLLLKIAEGTRTKNSLTVLTRLRGIQLFAESVCSPLEDLASRSLKQEGNTSHVLEKVGTELPYPDNEFWRRASDPILSSDAFSSLMWVLFCLPSRFRSCEDSFISLVHLFYGVSVAQAIITYFGKFQCNPSELGSDGALVSEIFNIMQECGFARQYFISNHMDRSYDLKSTIHGLSFPYLRRCALLWEIMNSSTSTPFGDGTPVSNISSQASDDMIEDVDGNIMEPAEVQALEKKFKIPPLDAILNDEVLSSLVSRWLRHFNKEFEAHYTQRVLPMSPAVPFRLMHLPDVYQDLIQRYIKQQCPDCNSAMDEPALCLLCGKLCTPHWKTCCRESGCQAHIMACGAGVGVFLLVRRTTILLQRAARQANWPSPYLDAFGEEDLEMARGKPLYLNEERYASLTYMVASHGIDRSSKVLRQTTVGAFLML